MQRLLLSGLSVLLLSAIATPNVHAQVIGASPFLGVVVECLAVVLIVCQIAQIYEMGNSFIVGFRLLQLVRRSPG